MKRSLYSLATDNEPHTWQEILSASTNVFDATSRQEEGVYFKEAMSYNKDCAVLWTQKGEKYVVKRLYVIPGGL